MMAKLLTRKFLVAAGSVLCATGLCAFGKINGGEFVTVVTVAVGAFQAAHAIADNAALRNGTGSAARVG